MMRRATLILLVLVLSMMLVACGSSDSSDGVVSPPNETSGPGSSSTAGAQGPDTVPALSDGAVRVTLGWDEPIDMDLELWDSLGENALTSAGLENGGDVTDGDTGREYLDLTGDYATGTYVVSVYFAEEENVVDSATATLTVYKADGSTEVRSRSIAWEKGSDQWHAFEIDAATGDIVDVNEIVEVEVTE